MLCVCFAKFQIAVDLWFCFVCCVWLSWCCVMCHCKRSLFSLNPPPQIPYPPTYYTPPKKYTPLGLISVLPNTIPPFHHIQANETRTDLGYGLNTTTR